jgi:hypothetical protein
MCQNSASEDISVPDDQNPEASGNENTETPEKQQQRRPEDSAPVPGAFTPFGQPGRQDVISPTTMVTPAGLFNVFDPGTAPEDVFLAKRQPGYPLKPLAPAPSPSADSFTSKATQSSAPATTPAKAPQDGADETRNLFHPPSTAARSMPANSTQTAPARARENPESDTVGIAILCVLFFVVSCAATVILGPRIAGLFATVFHLQQ